jgi:hypothetical protein
MESDANSPMIRWRAQVESAALAGIVYSVLAVISISIVFRVPNASTEEEWSDWIGQPRHRRMLLVGLTLASIAAVAFLWFVAVVRRRVGEREDQFYATVFLGSALVSVAIWLVAISSITALAVAGVGGRGAVGLDTARFARGFTFSLLLVAGPRVQALFVASTSTIFLRTKIVPKWLAYLGYAAAVVMTVVPVVTSPLGLGLPSFVLVSSAVILFVTEIRTAEPGRVPPTDPLAT